jgi:hypothetical protein
MMDEVARAYAILGLPAGANEAAVRRRYRALVRQWHPDRYAADPVAQAEATSRVSVINGAVHAIIEARAHLPESDRPDSRRLSREELERIVASLGKNSPIDWLLDRMDPTVVRVTRSQMTLRLAAIPTLITWIAFEAAAISLGRTWPPWLVLTVCAVAYAASYRLLLRVLPDE